MSSNISIVIGLFLLTTFQLIAQEKSKIYLIPGQGADQRLFSNLEFPEHYEVCHINFIVPDEGEQLSSYAAKLSEQIDTSERFSIVGTSLGGMIASEMNNFLNPEKVIIISSARNSTELPKRYTFQKNFPIYKCIGPRLAKWGAQVLQPIVEPDRRKEKGIFKAMLKAKDPIFMRRSIEMIINWENNQTNEDIIHIHGDNDHTLPIKTVNCDFIIDDGSHMMTLTRGKEISEIINFVLND